MITHVDCAPILPTLRRSELKGANGPCTNSAYCPESKRETPALDLIILNPDRSLQEISEKCARSRLTGTNPIKPTSDQIDNLTWFVLSKENPLRRLLAAEIGFVPESQENKRIYEGKAHTYSNPLRRIRVSTAQSSPLNSSLS